MGTGLHRSRENRWIGGVCGGIAERYGWPPGLVRFLYAFISVISTAFPGTLFYLILWIFVPEGDASLEDEDVVEIDDASDLSRGVALALVGLLGLLGAHRFYAGRFVTGALMLLTGGGLLVWWLVDLILVATGEFRDVEGRRLLFWEREDRQEEWLLDASPPITSPHEDRV
jgi:phage shock protein C